MSDAVEAGAVVWVDGDDADAFLQGLLSNEITALPVDAATPALLLDATGHIRVALRAVRTADTAFTLLTDSGSGERLAELLEQYHFSEDVEIIGPEVVDVLTFPADATPAGADLVIAGTLPDTLDAIGDAAAIQAATASAPMTGPLRDAARIAAGIPRFDRDINERTLVHEAGLQSHAVSFDKGCYLGQETVARVEYRGGVNRRLVGLRLPASAHEGDEVHLGERLVGTLTSVADHPLFGPIALATLRKEAAAGAAVTVADLEQPAIVVALPFPALTPP